MISFISKWAEQLVVALIIANILEMIIPKGKSKKYIKMLIGVYIIFTIVSPVVGGNYNFSIDSIVDTIKKYGTATKEIENVNSMDVRLREMYIEEVEKSVSNDLAELGYKVTKCKIEADIKDKIEKSVITGIEIRVKKYVMQSNSSVENIENVNISINVGEKENTTSIDDEDIKIIKMLISDKYGIQDRKIHILD